MQDNFLTVVSHDIATHYVPRNYYQSENFAADGSFCC